MFVQVVDETVVDAIIAATEGWTSAALPLLGAAGSAVRGVGLGVWPALHLVAGREAKAGRGNVSWRAAPVVQPPRLRSSLNLYIQPHVPDPALQWVVMATLLPVALGVPCRQSYHLGIKGYGGSGGSGDGKDCCGGHGDHDGHNGLTVMMVMGFQKAVTDNVSNY